MLRVLCIDDDVRLYELLAAYLEPNGVSLVHAADGPKGLAALGADVFDAVLLDVMMPGMDGLTVCRRIREQSRVPIIMLTARGDEADRVVGLELGADDYVPKPFNPRELLARIRAVLRRAGDVPEHRADAAARNLRFAGWTLEPARRRLLNPEGAEVALTGGEYDLLLALAGRANRVLTRDMLLDLLRGRQAAPFDRAIDVAISRLRRKLEDDGRNAQLIKTVRGGGYVLAATVERA
jgi:two-component system, OmpR family, response regulator